MWCRICIAMLLYMLCVTAAYCLHNCCICFAVILNMLCSDTVSALQWFGVMDVGKRNSGTLIIDPNSFNKNIVGDVGVCFDKAPFASPFMHILREFSHICKMDYFFMIYNGLRWKIA